MEQIDTSSVKVDPLMAFQVTLRAYYTVVAINNRPADFNLFGMQSSVQDAFNNTISMPDSTVGIPAVIGPEIYLGQFTVMIPSYGWNLAPGFFIEFFNTQLVRVADTAFGDVLGAPGPGQSVQWTLFDVPMNGAPPDVTITFTFRLAQDAIPPNPPSPPLLDRTGHGYFLTVRRNHFYDLAKRVYTFR